MATAFPASHAWADETAKPPPAPAQQAAPADQPPSSDNKTSVRDKPATSPAAEGKTDTTVDGRAKDEKTDEAKKDGDKKDDGKKADNKPNAAADSMCLMIESAAGASNLPLEFFARVIWQESRFQPDAVGPVTRNGQRAQGVAQFMPGTANERRLLDPFDPVQALPKSAEFLAELRDQFGNLGLAAAAYNAGPRRVREWLDGTGYMPEQTRNYVYAITGVSVDEWAKAGQADVKDRPKPAGCSELVALLKQAPNPFVAGLEQRIQISALSPWGVQLAAGFSRDRALAMYARAMKRLSPVIGDHDPNLLSSSFRSRGWHAFYQVRIGAQTREAANDICGKIHRAGEACIVLRNWNTKG